jgi:hypothetical protein
MSYPDLNRFSKDSGAGEASVSVDITLRLIASLPAPEGLDDRVHAALRAAPRRARVLAWPIAPAGEWLRAAAAAAIVFVVAGGGWGIYAHVQPGQLVRGIAGSRVGATTGFSEGGAVRRPQTLVGPTVITPSTNATPKPKAPAKTGAIAASRAKNAAKSTTLSSTPSAAPTVR